MANTFRLNQQGQITFSVDAQSAASTAASVHRVMLGCRRAAGHVAGACWDNEKGVRPEQDPPALRAAGLVRGVCWEFLCVFCSLCLLIPLKPTRAS